MAEEDFNGFPENPKLTECYKKHYNDLELMGRDIDLLSNHERFRIMYKILDAKKYTFDDILSSFETDGEDKVTSLAYHLTLLSSCNLIKTSELVKIKNGKYKGKRIISDYTITEKGKELLEAFI